MNKPATVSTSVRLKVPYHDVDNMNVVWHGNYLKYFEVAREAIFEYCGVDKIMYACYQRTNFIFPIVRCSIKYIKPIKFRDEFICTVKIREAHRRIILDFEIALVADGVVCTRGTTEQVAVHAPTMKLELLIPEEIRNALGG